MTSLIFAAFIALLGVAALFVPIPEQYAKIKKLGAGVLVFGGIGLAAAGGVAYNDAGYCQHIRTITSNAPFVSVRAP